MLTKFTKTETISKMQNGLILTLADLVESRDKCTGDHVRKTAAYVKLIFEEMKEKGIYKEEVTDELIENALNAAPLHDVGKIGVPDSVINKPTKLTEDEYDQIKQHPVMGYEILKNITEMPELAIAAKYHHERYDGKGYPEGLRGEEIPEAVRIISCADAYDAMSSRRSYHDVYAQEYIREEFRKGMGTQFDPKFARIMLEMIDEDSDYEMREV